MRRRTLLAFVLAPAVVPIVVFVLTVAEDTHLRERLLVAGVYATFTYGAAIIFGIPALILFERKGWTRWWQYTAAGAAIGFAVMMMFWIARPPMPDVRVFLIFAGIGSASALVFWALSRPSHAA